MGDMGTMMWGGFGLALLGLALLTVFVGGVAYVLLPSRRNSRSAIPPQDEALEIVRRRYAAGEIDEDDYLQRMSFIDRS